MRLNYLKHLNREQRKAVKYGIKAESSKHSAPLLVIAGAGTGKTKTVAHRVAYFLANGADPNRIMLLTFSRRAAEEMTSRVKQIQALRKQDDVKLPWAGTFHSVAVRLLRKYAKRIGLNPAFTIHDRSDSEDLMDLVRHDLGLSEQESIFPKKPTCLKIYSYMVNAAAGTSKSALKRVLKAHFPFYRKWARELYKLFKGYGAVKAQQHVLDFDDLLLHWARMMKHSDLAEEVRGLIDHVLVDEYQDTNPLQAKILLRLKPDGRGLTVVGDDAQAIYSFRAATVRNILDFPNQFEPPAKIIKLERNYRSTQPILNASNAVIALGSEGFAKKLWSDRQSARKPRLVTVQDEAEQARYVAKKIVKAREAGIPLEEQAVLFRSSNHSAELEIELTRLGVPFVKFGGLKFLDAAHVKDVLGLLRWCENPRDKVSGFRSLQLLPRIGGATAARILEELAAFPNRTNGLSKVSVPKAAQQAWPDFVKLIARMRRGNRSWPADMQVLCEWFRPQLQRLYDDFPTRVSDIEQLEQIAGGYGSREQFLTNLTLDPIEGSRGDLNARPNIDECTVLSTIHSAKGQEWSVVRILNVVDGCIPSSRVESPEAIEEERRLLYVAMSRAKDELDLLVPSRFVSPRQRYGSGGRVVRSVSRLIPRRIQNLFDRRPSSKRRLEENGR
jgi:DNA helicase II / ATP-dependent DNA helicase PcrA